MLHKGGKIPRHEQVVGERRVAENGLPVPRRSFTRGFPARAQLWIERRTMLLQEGHEGLGYLAAKGALGDSRVVAGFGDYADLIFDLNHEHGMPFTVHLVQMPH